MNNGDKIFNNIVEQIFSPLYQLLVGIAFLYFFYGVMKYIMDMNDPEKKNTGKGHLLYGTIGLFIILSVGGILKLFNSVFGGLFVF